MKTILQTLTSILLFQMTGKKKKSKRQKFKIPSSSSSSDSDSSSSSSSSSNASDDEKQDPPRKQAKKQQKQSRTHGHLKRTIENDHGNPTPSTSGTQRHAPNTSDSQRNSDRIPALLRIGNRRMSEENDNHDHHDKKSGHETEGPSYETVEIELTSNEEAKRTLKLLETWFNLEKSHLPKNCSIGRMTYCRFYNGKNNCKNEIDASRRYITCISMTNFRAAHICSFCGPHRDKPQRHPASKCPFKKILDDLDQMSGEKNKK